MKRIPISDRMRKNPNPRSGFGEGIRWRGEPTRSSRHHRRAESHHRAGGDHRRHGWRADRGPARPWLRTAVQSRSTAARSAMGERAHRRGAWHRCRPPFFSGDEVAARSLSFSLPTPWERRGERGNEPRVQRQGLAGRFCSGETRGQPSDGDGRSRATGPAPQPRRDRAQGRNPGPGPGCGLGAGERARTAGRGAALSARMGRGCWAGFRWRARAREQAVGRACAGWAEMVK